jgi:predicted GNAT family N-acyltransferase
VCCATRANNDQHHKEDFPMQAAVDFRAPASAGRASSSGALPAGLLALGEAAPVGGLQVRVLRGAVERQAIARLRRHAAFDTENDLRLGLQPFEQTRDEIGHVQAVYRAGRVIASARAVPTGHGLTAAERLLQQVPFDGSVLGTGSWEIGRMVMEEDERDPRLLQECLALCLEEFLHANDVRHVHATTSTPAMARLWRRLGLRTLATAVGTSGTRYALVHAPIRDLMAALHVPHYINEPTEFAAPAARPDRRNAVLV